MKNCKLLAIFIALLFAVCTSSCDLLHGSPSGNLKFFSDALLGTWVSNDTGVYSGKLQIDFDTITITGYGENQTPPEGDDNKRPLKDYPKGVPLKGYSEEGKIFINYGGTAQTGIPYIYTEGEGSQYKLLEFTFGGRKEILQIKSQP